MTGLRWYEVLDEDRMLRSGVHWGSGCADYVHNIVLHHLVLWTGHLTILPLQYLEHQNKSKEASHQH